MLNKKYGYNIRLRKKNKIVVMRMMRPGKYAFSNYLKLKRKGDIYAYYSSGIKVDYKDKVVAVIIKGMESKGDMTLKMLRHPIIFEIDPFFKTVKVANISHGFTEIEGIDVEYIGLRKDGKETGLFGPKEISLKTYKEGNNFLEMVRNSKEFDYEKELLPETYEKLINKCKMEKIDNEEQEQRLSSIVWDFGYKEQVLKIEPTENILKKYD